MSQDKTNSFRHRIRSKILAEARTWLGTPYKHQASVKQVGVDCISLVVQVGRIVGVLPITDDEIASYSGYGRLPNPKRMAIGMAKYLNGVQSDDVQVGDIAWIQWRASLPMHLALVGEFEGRRTLIHALGDIGKVTEHTLDTVWEERVVSYWRYPGML